MSIRKKLGEKLGKWVNESPVIEKGLESIVNKTKDIVTDDLNQPISGSAELMLGMGALVVGSIILTVAMKGSSKSKADILEPMFRTITINNYYS